MKGLNYPTNDEMGYSTDEVETGLTWIDGSTIYKKTVHVNSLPNATTQSYAHGISNIDKIIKFEGFARNASGTLYALPHVNLTDIKNGIYITVGKANIIIDTGEIDRSSCNGEVTIYYTKPEPEAEE